MQPGMSCTKVKPFKMDNLGLDLTDGAFVGYWVDLTGDEATSVIGKAKALEDGFYITGLDMFHQLHCVVSLVRR
jgi:hypothetical protein